MSKIAADISDCMNDVPDGATVLISGFGEAGSPTELIHELARLGRRNLTVVSNNAGNGELGLAALLKTGSLRRLICSYPRGSHSHVFNELYAAGRIELELVPQGTLAERIRAGGAGIAAFYTPTAADTELAAGKETRNIGGRTHVLEWAITADLALVKAERADTCGNLVYNKTARNFGPVMCTAARQVIVQVRTVVEAGEIDPEHVVTPGIFVDRIVAVPRPVSEAAALADTPP